MVSTNGHDPEAIPVAEQAEPVIDNSNGHGGGPPPGLEDLFMSPSRGRPDLDTEMLRGSDDASELLARSDFTDREIAAMVRQTARYNRVRYGSSNWDQMVKMLATLKLSRNRESRREYVQVRIGQAASAMGQLRQGTKNTLRKFRSMDRAEIET